ncbi:hypothetical protein OQ252_02195 [Acetobacter farinalis]|uniref:Lipoprotein n=1 Tax=Acetobacter farinalis TaxID=1260984 RepID=A0ABT3Q4K8_9PROT|nr:hypothetical protein [Acetobacter farinalis]MCX2560218.1 hypothetical protein [Acetobacter farinalis]NHO28874.1 hypothetical protein [Acetobacter farinalis]
MKRFSMCARLLPGIFLLGLLGLNACADDDQTSRHYYHPRQHHGQRNPSWYRPPANTQQ